MKFVLVALACMGLFASCAKDKNVNQKTGMEMESIFEIAINQSKEEEHPHFLETRRAFVEVLGKEAATLNEGKWQPFFTVAPNLDLKRILIGMTEWNSMQGFGEAAARLLPQEEARNYFASFDPLAYALLEPVDGKPFDMNSIKQDGLVVEFAVRKGKTPDAFGQKRDDFFNHLNTYSGYKFAREFKVHKLGENGMPALAENTQAVIIVWESAEAFQAAAQPIFSTKEYADFAANLEVEVYFASYPTK